MARQKRLTSANRWLIVDWANLIGLGPRVYRVDQDRKD